MPTLPVELMAAIDAACDRFESAWAASEGADGPECECFVDDLPEAARAEGLRELFQIERQYRAQRGQNQSAWANDRPAIAELAAAARDDAETLAGGQARQMMAPAGGGGLRLRCPHCQAAVEMAPDGSLDEIACRECGKLFTLTGALDQDDSQPPEIGRFLLRDRLGVGGFGAVWRARDPELDRDVALKTPRRGQLTPYETELFFREARAAAQLAHPGIVSIFEVGRDENSGAIYLVSELVDGEPLSEAIKKRRLSRREAAALVADVADALHYAHERGVVHRDLKPSNIMLDRYTAGGETVAITPELGRPRLMDFGLAKRDTGEITMTVDGQVLGTPAYMSPEQAGGQVRWVDRRSDIYSLGVVLFRLLTNELPFRGSASAQIQQRLTDDAPNARRLDETTPLDLATVCAKCLERDQARRYKTAAEVAAEMRRFLAGEPVLARPLSVWGRAGRWARRRPASATALGLVLALAVTGTTAAIVIARQNDDLTTQIEENNALIAEQEKRVDELRAKIAHAGATRQGAADSIEGWRRRAIERLWEEHGPRLLTAARAEPADSQAGAKARIALARLMLLAAQDEQAESLLAELGQSPPAVELAEQLTNAIEKVSDAADSATDGRPGSASFLLAVEARIKQVNKLVGERDLNAEDVSAISAAMIGDD